MKLPTDTTVLTFLLLAAATGLSFLPIVVLVANPDPASIGAIGTAYTATIAVVAPLVSRRRRNGNDGSNDGDND